MGEIKNTMDIIMEKTKGLIQKFLDGILDLDRLKVDVAALSGKRGVYGKINPM